MENFLGVSNLISVAFLLLGIASAIAALVFLAPTRDFVSWMRSRLAGWTVPPPGRLLRVLARPAGLAISFARGIYRWWRQA
ncbi:hypothetical protein N656DRAFT_433715 [Canariomyces notabilis]|uniref:Uncharacterized protein n=1 Tax=Canariomyces notabilis TaxID=2074819 RepID=A0AAN6QE01_9PEZI|nr:hypothetical protein N656DRAFT_433715 [Canariomyces arenarius]